MVLLGFLALGLLIRSQLPRLQIFLAPSEAGTIGTGLILPRRQGGVEEMGSGLPRKLMTVLVSTDLGRRACRAFLLVDREPMEFEADDGALIRGVEVRVR